MANLLPYAIVAGIAVVFFVVCYILFSGGSSEKEEKKGKNRHGRAASERPGQGKSSLGYDEAEKRRSAQPQQPVREDTAPIPRISNVTVRERQENPDETAFVTTKGEAVRRDGKIVYEEPHRPAKKQEHLDATQVLSREEILEAMDKIDKEEAAAHKAKEEEAKKKDMAETLRSANAAERPDGERDGEEAPNAALADMAAVVAADLAAKSQGEAAARPGRRIEQEVMAETAKAAAKGVSDETQVISPAALRRKQEETAAAADETVMFDAGRLSDAMRQTGAAPARDETAVMPPVRQHTHTDAGNETKQQKSPWDNDLSRSAAKAAPMAGRPSIWEAAPEADSPFMSQCTAHFLRQFGMVTEDMKAQAASITAAAFRRIGCRSDGERKKALSSLLAQEALQNVQKAYVAHPKDYVAAMALQAFADIVQGSPVSTRHLVAVDALKIMPYLSDNHYKILSVLLLFLYSRNSHNVDAETFGQYIDKYVLPFLDGFPTERPYYQQLDYLHCTAFEGKETHFAEILADSYPLLFRYRGFTEEELRKVLKGTPMPAEYIVRSFNSPLVKLAMIDESMATRFFRLAGISDRAMQSQLLRLAKKRPAGFGGEEALDIMEDISPVLADLGDIWDSTMLRISTLSLLGLYLAQGYIKEQIGEEFDLSRWFE